MWIELQCSLPIIDHWWVAGDCNMLEDPHYRSGDSGVTMHVSELSTWEKFVDILFFASVASSYNILNLS